MYRSYDQLGDQPQQNRDVYDVVDIANLNHKNDIISKNKVVCIDYYADWCGPCKQTASAYSLLATNHSRPGECAVVKYNIDKIDQKHPDRNLITGIPTFQFYINGVRQDQHTVVGGDIQAVEEKLKNILSQSNNSFANVGPMYNKNSIRQSKLQIPSMMDAPSNPYQSNSGNYHQPYQTYR